MCGINWWRKIDEIELMDVHMFTWVIIKWLKLRIHLCNFIAKRTEKNPKCSILICANVKFKSNETKRVKNIIELSDDAQYSAFSPSKISQIIFIKAWNWKFLKWCWSFKFHSFRFPKVKKRFYSRKHQKKLKWTEKCFINKSLTYK